MTSGSGVKSRWTCGFSSIIEELGRLASLEYPIYPEPQERSSQPTTTTKLPPPSSTPSLSETSIMPVPRLSLPRPAFLKPNLPRTTPTPLRPFSTSGPPLEAWTGRPPEEHAVNRTEEKDVHSKTARQGLREKEKGDSAALGVSEKGGADNKKAEKEEPEAPTPVIGMNDERGGKGR